MRRCTGEEEEDEENDEAEPEGGRIGTQGDYGGWSILKMEKGRDQEKKDRTVVKKNNN